MLLHDSAHVVFPVAPGITALLSVVSGPGHVVRVKHDFLGSQTAAAAPLHFGAMARPLWLIFTLLLVSATAPTSRADENRYSELIADAIVAQQQEDFERARALFTEAHALEPSARTLRGLGVVAFRQTDMVGAFVYLSASLQHPNKPLDEELQASVKLLLAEVRGKVARFSLKREPSQLTLTMDGQPPVRGSEGELVVLPGVHTLHASLPGYLDQSFRLEAHPGLWRVLNLALIPGALAQPTQPFAAVPSPVSMGAPSRLEMSSNRGAGDDERASRRGVRTAIWTTLALGSGLTVSAVVLTAIGFRRVNLIEQRCGDACYSAYVDEQTERAKLHGIERGIEVTSVTAAVSLGTAFGLWLWERRGTRRKQSARSNHQMHPMLRF